ncbi:Uncharacterised protein [Vibrio cholerae]|nr:Uncharacterised protein [Vibrio cholerae]CSC75175.1 Uncharacterised protein [Vibrio cholerae]CSD99723.1 Uncharacterised protein [Vibrio cholerae]
MRFILVLTQFLRPLLKASQIGFLSVNQLVLRLMLTLKHKMLSLICNKRAMRVVLTIFFTVRLTARCIAHIQSVIVRITIHVRALGIKMQPVRVSRSSPPHTVMR